MATTLMGLTKIFRKDYIVGLDIGSTSIKLAQFLKKEDGLHLVKADLKEMAMAYIGDEASVEKETLALLKRMIKGIDIKKSKFVVTINCPKTAIKNIIAPYMPKAELRNGIRLAAKNYFPFPIGDASLDFEILGDVVEKGIKKYEVLVATSPKKTIGKFLSIMEKAGIKPSSFVPIPYALQGLVKTLHPKEEKTICFLDLGYCHTELVIFKERVLVFSRKIPVAGNDITKEMTGVLLSDKGRTGLSLDEAEKIKRETGIPRAGESKMINSKISTTQIFSMVRTPLEQLVSEIDRCFDYYREESDGGTVDSVALLGGGASLKGITDFLSDELDMEVKLGNPLEGLKVESGVKDESMSSMAHRIAAAIGAGLSEAKGVNLLPPEIKEETKHTFKRATVQAIVVGTVLTLALVYIGMRIQLTNFQKRTDAARVEILSLQPQIEQVEAQDLADQILQDEPYWEDVFKELSNIIPNNIYLTEFVMKDKTIKMRGVVTSSEPEGLLSSLILGLENGIFKNVRLVGTKEVRDKAGNEFELECWVD